MAEPSAAQKRMLAKMGLAMPDGSYYIRNGAVGASDLQNAIKAVGRGGADHDDIRKHIIKRANALKLEKEIPDTWNSDGSLKEPAAAQSAVDLGEEFIAHFGRKGMRWGARVFTGGGSSGSTPNQHASADAQRAINTAHTIQKHGVHAVSNPDLQHLVTRLNLEKQHGNLTHPNPGGKDIALNLLKNAGKQQAQSLVNQYAAKGAEHAAKHLARSLVGSGRHAA